MNPENLRTHLQRFYGARRPPEDVVQRIQAAVREGAARPPPRRWTRRRMALGIAAAALLGALGAWRISDDGASPALAEEVAAHYRACTLDVAQSRIRSFEEAVDELDDLGFRIQVPASLRTRDLEVLGARRCMFRGRAVAEIRVREASGAEGMLLVAPPLQEAPERRTLERVVAGLRVALWSEAGLTMSYSIPA